MFSLTNWLSSKVGIAKRKQAQRPRPTIMRRLFRPGLEDLEHRITPANIIWEGDLSSLMNVAGNWAGGVLPGANDTLVFNATASSFNVTNNFANNTTFVGIQFNAGGFTISPLTPPNGNSIRLLAGITNTAGTNTINTNLVLGGSQVFNITAGQVTLGGAVSGAATASLTKAGEGTLTFNGNNTYTGLTVVFGGRLQLNDTSAGANPNALNGGLTIDGGTAVVELLNDNQILNTITVSILNGGVLDLNNNLEQLAGLTLVGGNVDIDAGGDLTLSGNVTANASTFVSSIDGPGFLSLIGTRTFTVANGTAADDLVVSAVIDTTGGLVKAGAGLMALSAANNYTGITTVSAGILEIRNATALGVSGTVANRTAVSAGATVQLANGIDVGNEVLYLGGTLSSLLGNTTWAGNITLVANSIIDVDAGELLLTGLISGAFGVTKVGTGTVEYGGTVSNTYTGITRVNEGVLELDMAGLNALSASGALIIGDGLGGANADQVVLLGNDQIPNTKPITINSSGLLNLNGFNDTVGALTLVGGSIATGAGRLTLGANVVVSASTTTAVIDGQLNLGTVNRTFTVADGAADPDLRIDALIIGNVNLVKAGTGKLTLTDANIDFTGATTVSAGTLEIQNNQALGVAGGTGTTVVNGATLSLNSVAGITVGETLTLNGAGFGGGGALRNQAGDNTYTGNITLATSSSIFVQADSLTVSGAGDIAGAAGRTLTKSGAGELILQSANTYAGATIVSQGILNIQNAAALGTGTNAAANGTTVSAGAQLQLQNVNVANERLTLNGAGPFGTGALHNVAGDNTWGGSVVLATASTVNVVDAADTLTFSNVVSGSGRLTKTGLGTLAYTGAASNTNTGGTTVADGILELNKANAAVAIVSALTIGDNVGLGSTAVVQYNAAAGTNQIANTVAVTVNLDGELNLNNVNDTIGPLNLGGGVVNTGTGILTLNGNVTGTGAADTSVVNGLLSLGAATRTFTIANGAADPDVLINAIISGVGAAGITKAGAGTLQLDGANTYAGVTTVSAGTLLATDNAALGLNPAGTTVATGGTLALDQGIAVAEALTLAGGTLLNVAGNNTWTGTVALSANSIISANAGTLQLTNTVSLGSRILTVQGAGDVDIDGVISGAGGRIVKAGVGTLDISAANTYTGGTTINGGAILVNNATGSGLGTGAVAVNNGGTLGGSGRVSGAVNVTSGGQINPGTLDGSTIADLATGPVTFQLNGIFAPDLDFDVIPVADQLDVVGLVRLNNATLLPNVVNDPGEGEDLTIIDNDGTDAIIGTFNGLAEGATFGADGRLFTITYVGGTGNDVVITQINNTAPIIGGAAPSALDDNQVGTPFSLVTIVDAGNVTVTITLSDGDDNGTLTGGGFVHSGVGIYTLSSSTAAVAQAAIRALQFTPTENQVAPGDVVQTTFSIDVFDGALHTLDSNTVVSVTSINDDPVLTDLIAAVTYLENTVNATPQQIDADVTLTDPDTGGFLGGSVQVTYDALDLGSAADQLDVGNFGDITVTGANVFFDFDPSAGVNNVQIGTIDAVDDGVNGNDLEIDLNAAATTAAVEALIEALTYQNTSNDPAATRTIEVTFNDGDGGVTTQETQITITAENDGPIVLSLSDTLQYSGPAATVIDANVTVTDADSPDFDGGSLVVNYGGGSGTAFESIAVSTAGNFSINGGNLEYDNGTVNVIGTITGGAAGAPLSINFTSALVTDAVVQELLRDLRYTNTEIPPSTDSTLRFILSDGDGGVTTVNKNINFAPTLANLTDTLNYSGNLPSQIDSDVTLTDIDSPDYIGGQLNVTASGGTGDEDLSIDISGSFAIAGTTLSYLGEAIGTITSDGQNGSALTISFNTSFATVAAVQDLLQALQFAQNPNGGVQSIALQFDLSDGDGGNTVVNKPVDITP
jgi:fibronectin-binding autotransporter adhesin